MLLKFQRKNLIETTESSTDSDDNKLDTMRLMESKNPLIRFSIYRKIKRMMNSFKEDKLKSYEKNLLKGVYMRKIKDFKEDETKFH